MKTYPKIPTAAFASLMTLSASQASIVPFAEYHLGEAGSLSAPTNNPQDESGHSRNFGGEINGALSTTGSASFHPNAAGSTAYLDTSSAEAEGWFSGGLNSSLPADNFAFGVFVRAAAHTGDTSGDVFTIGGSNGSFKLSLEANGWAASCHNVAWIGEGGGTTGSFQADTWVHLALIRSGGVATFYIDGVAQSGTFGGIPVHDTGHVSVNPGGANYFDGHIDEARVVTFTPGESAANIITALQQGVVPTSFVNVGPDALFATAPLSTDDASAFRLGGAITDYATVTGTDGLSVIAGTAPKHLIQIEQEGEVFIGTYPLIDYTGTIGGLGFAGFQLAPLPGRITGTLVHNTVDTSIDLEITGSTFGNVMWTGANDGTWDVGSTSNWVFTGTSDTTQFYAGDAVNMDDSAAIKTITVATTVTPSSVFIDSSEDYSFSGAGIGGSGSLTKNGTGTATFTNANSNTGPIYIDGGTLRVGSGGSSGSLSNSTISNNGSLVIDRSGTLAMSNPIHGAGSIEKTGSGILTLSGANSFTGPVTLTAGTIASGNSASLGDASEGTTVAAGATLDVNAVGFGGEPIIAQGSGVDGLGAVVNSSATGQLWGVKTLTLGADTTIGGIGRWDVRGENSAVAGNFKLTKIGDNQISLVLATVTVKDIDVDAGLLAIEYGTIVDDSNPGTITVHAGGVLAFSDFFNPISCSKPIVLDGGSLDTTSASASGNAIVASPIGLSAATNTVNVRDGSALTLSGTVSGSGALVKTDTGILALSAAPAYTGDTTVAAGTLSLAQGGLADGSTVHLGAAATLTMDYTGTDSVLALFIDGVPQSPGIYTSAHASGRFAGSGSLTVTSGPASGYSSWETSNGIAGAGGGTDSDGDGITNGIEFVLGGDPSGPGSDSNHLLPTSTMEGSALVFVFRRSDASIGNNPFVEYGSTLAGWTTAQDGVDDVTIVVENDFPDPGIDRVTVTLPDALATGSKLFARLRVDIP